MQLFELFLKGSVRTRQILLSNSYSSADFRFDANLNLMLVHNFNNIEKFRTSTTDKMGLNTIWQAIDLSPHIENPNLNRFSVRNLGLHPYIINIRSTFQIKLCCWQQSEMRRRKRKTKALRLWFVCRVENANERE